MLWSMEQPAADIAHAPTNAAGPPGGLGRIGVGLTAADGGEHAASPSPIVASAIVACAICFNVFSRAVGPIPRDQKEGGEPLKGMSIRAMAQSHASRAFRFVGLANDSHWVTPVKGAEVL